MPRRQRRQPTTPNRSLAAVAARVAARLWLLWQSGSPVVRVGGTTLAFCALALAVILTQTPTAAGSAPGALARFAVGPTTLPDVASWQDAQEKTAFSIRLKGSTIGIRSRVGTAALPPTGQYSFTLPTGEQIVGVASITTQDNGQFSAVSDCQQAQLASTQPRVVLVHLEARFDASALVAYAQLDYIVAEINADGGYANANEIGIFCKNGAGTLYEMSAGCDPNGACADPVAVAPQGITQYQSQLMSASANPSKGAWEAVYNASSTALRGEYTPDQFAAAMNTAQSKTGKITAITPGTAPIQIQIAPTGQAYATSVDTVTYAKDGKTTTRQVTSYYLLDGGTWQFWFSM